MVIRAIFAFLHFAAVFGFFAAVFVEWQTMSSGPTCAEARRIQRCDRWYGILAVVILVVGFLRVYDREGQGLLLRQSLFPGQDGAFVLVGLLSIYPTIRFIKWRAQTRQGLAPSLTVLMAATVIEHSMSDFPMRGRFKGYSG